MPRGGKRSSAWTSETAPRGKGSSKHRTTKIKEALGPKGWDRFKTFMETDGAEKLVEEMSKLKGKDYNIAYSMMAEYVKPKLQRVTMAGEKENPLHMHSTVDVNALDADTAKKLLDATCAVTKPDSPAQGEGSPA